MATMKRAHKVLAMAAFVLSACGAGVDDGGLAETAAPLTAVSPAMPRLGNAALPMDPIPVRPTRPSDVARERVGTLTRDRP